jgi:phage gp37-like protein
MIEAVQNAILARARSYLGAKVANYEALPASLDMDAQLSERVHATPCVFVAFMGGPALADDTTRIDATFAVLLLTDSPSERHRRLDAIPALEILVPALDLFWVPDVGTLRLVEVSNLYSDKLDAKGLTLFSVACKIPLPFALPTDNAADRLAPFETFHADWTPVPPDAPHPTAPLPLPDRQAAASDHVHLQGDHS